MNWIIPVITLLALGGLLGYWIVLDRHAIWADALRFNLSVFLLVIITVVFCLIENAHSKIPILIGFGGGIVLLFCGELWRKKLHDERFERSVR